MKKLILYYFYTFLFIDLINGFVLRYLNLSPMLSPGQLARGILTLLLLIHLLSRERITNQNKYIYMFILLFPAALFINIVRDGVFYKILLEVISFSKPLFFLLLFNFVYINRLYFGHKLDKIMKINLLIFSTPIILSSITGVGLATYEAFYGATQSFFYGANVTSITGFTLSIYYAYKLRTGKINYLYYSLAFLALFLSGGKIILTLPIITLFIYLFNGKKSKLRNVSVAMGLIILTLFFIVGIFNSGIFVNNAFTQKYYSRAFTEALTGYSQRSEINIAPLFWYSYISISRAQRANEALNAIFYQPENLFFGFGVTRRPHKFEANSNILSTAEMDIIDMFVFYGIIGALLIYIPIFKIIFPLIIRRNSGMNAMIIYIIFIYSSLAGHVLTTPMAGSLFALFLGLGSSSNGKYVRSVNILPKSG